MKRLVGILGLMLFAALLGAGSASATTYYIAANGIDTNNGTTKTTPFLHAPGMPNCSGTCASTTPQPGDSFIFRGGDTWHTSNSSASPYIGVTIGRNCTLGGTTCGWGWIWSGSSTNCNWPTSSSSCIYIGVDKTWYSGGSWSRPKVYMDNPPSRSLVASCTYDQSAGPYALSIGNTGAGPVTSYVIFDSFEIYGHCHSQRGPTPIIQRFGYYISIINCYFHGWTETDNPQPNGSVAEDIAAEISWYPGRLSSTTHNVVAYDVFDGSDAYCTGNRKCSGGPAVSGDAYIFEYNVVRYIAGGVAGLAQEVLAHDNLFEDMYESFDPADHGDVDFMYGNHGPTGSTVSFYNNIIRNTNMGQTIALSAADQGFVYVFNNVWWGISNPSNCLAFYNTTTNKATFYVTNNTFDALCWVQMTNPNPHKATGNVYFRNNHFIGFSSSSISAIASHGGNSEVTVRDKGNEIFQTEAVANGQGYTPSNNYQPTSTSGATYHAGANLSSSCTTYSPDSALCNGSTEAVENTAGRGTIPTLNIASPQVRGTAWDAGAYQFSSASLSLPNPPSGRTAMVQ